MPDSPPNDNEYRTRLLAVYKQLLSRGELLAELPRWAVPYVQRNDGNLRDDADIDTALSAIPRLQAALAGITAYTPSKWLLEQELCRRRTGALAPLMGQAGAVQPPPAAAAPPSTELHSLTPSWISPPIGDARYEDVYDAAAREKIFGLCLSGGGIRSATFSLGILQALAEEKLLGEFSYLSTVSGGGYIHQWLASWIHNEAGGFKTVQQRLVPLTHSGSQARAPEQITWLRRYSSYLTPQRGIFSADTWTMITIWARNTFLNQIVLFGFLASCIWAIRAITYPFLQTDRHTLHPHLEFFLLLSLLLFLLAIVSSSTWLLWRSLSSITAKAETGGKMPEGALTDAKVLGWLVLPGFAFSLLFVLAAFGQINLGGTPDRWPGHGYAHLFFPIVLVCWGLYLTGLLLAVTFGGHAPHMFHKLRRATYGQPVFAGALVVSLLACVALSVAAAAYLGEPCGDVHMPHLQSIAGKAAGFLNDHLGTPSTVATPHQQLATPDNARSTLHRLFCADHPQRPASPITSTTILTIFAPVLFFFLQFLAIRLQLGIIGRFYTESRREWLARFGAWSAILSTGWIALSLLGLVGPAVFRWFFAASTLKMLGSALAVALVHAATLSAGASGKTDGTPKAGAFFGYSALDLLSIVGAPLCLVSLLIIVSGLVDRTIVSIDNFGDSVLAAIATVVTFLFFGWRVDVNAFSLHNFYQDRLARCYLGGNNPLRTPDPFTGFDDHAETSTGIELSDLLPVRFQPNPPQDAYDGPFPIFCSTINLTFGADLAAQERKGASFAFSPLYTGYHVGWTSETRPKPDTTFNGFVPTRDYAYRKGGIGLSAVTAISGAALSPNQGFSSQPAVAFLMTLFNVRLGWWIANPRKPKIWPSQKKHPAPAFGLRYLLAELFGLADDTSNYVCLCDGGRFEDMGMYELVRRRCRLIVVCDGEQENGDFQGIGGAISKCRTDFGAEINLDLQPLIPDPLTGRSAEHFRVGTIRYPPPPGGDACDERYSGYVVYLKTTYVGDEPGDILHHKKDDPAFPQDSTLNQWFTESSFESYRRLGQLTGELASPRIKACANAVISGPPVAVPLPAPPATAPVSVPLMGAAKLK
jgi:hypothetical protein